MASEAALTIGFQSTHKGGFGVSMLGTVVMALSRYLVVGYLYPQGNLGALVARVVCNRTVCRHIANHAMYCLEASDRSIMREEASVFSIQAPRLK